MDIPDDIAKAERIARHRALRGTPERQAQLEALALANKCKPFVTTTSACRDLVSSERRHIAIEHLEDYCNPQHPYARDGDLRYDYPSEYSPYAFTEEDCDAVDTLNVGVPVEARTWLLRGKGMSIAGDLLWKIPVDKAIWEVTLDEFEETLGEGSPAWELWAHLRETIEPFQKSPRKGWKVTASKLLARKRPKLIPLADSLVLEVLDFDLDDAWIALWCAFQEQDIRDGLARIQDEVPESTGLSLLRVLDILAWMEAKTRGKRDS